MSTAPSLTRTLLFGLGLFGSMACFCLPFGPKAASIGASAPPGPITADIAVPLDAKVLDEKGAPIPDQALQYVVNPSDVALVTASGDVRCTGTGDATVTITAGALKQDVIVWCRVVGSIDGTPPARVVLNKNVAFSPVAKDVRGAVLKDVPVLVTSSDEKVLAVVEGQLVGKAVGTAQIQVRAGDITVDTAVAVAEQLITESLSLKDGDGLNWALPDGTYEVEIGVTAMDGSESGVTVSWVGSDCPAQPEAQKHSFVCVVKSAASLQVMNPTRLGIGPMESGFVNVYRVPSSQ